MRNLKRYYTKTSKYHNRKCEYKGIKFDSEKERDYYMVLENYVRNGRIKDLELQKSYELIPTVRINNKTYRKRVYKADFVYITTNDNKIHIVDVKGFKTDIYKFKKQLMAYKYGIDIEEV